MIKHHVIPLEDVSAWNDALRNIKHAFSHTWDSCRAMYATTGLRTYLYCFEAGNTRIVCPLSERMFSGSVDIVTPYGFSGFVGNTDFPDFPRYWREFARNRGYVCGYIGLNPLLKNNSHLETASVYRYNSIYVVDLLQSYDELFENLSTNRKRQLKNWPDMRTAIVVDKAATIDFLLKNYLDFFRRKEAASVYHFSRDTMSLLANSKQVILAGILHNGRIEAVSVFAYTPDVGEYLFNISLPEGRHHSVLLLWYGITHLKSLSIPFLNLGGGIRADDGVDQFKQRFGPVKLELESMKQIYNPQIYSELCRSVGRDPTDMGGYFPAYRKS